MLLVMSNTSDQHSKYGLAGPTVPSEENDCTIEREDPNQKYNEGVLWCTLPENDECHENNTKE